MKIKDKMRNIAKATILTIIIILGICAISIPYVTAVVNEGNSAAKAEIFKDDIDMLNTVTQTNGKTYESHPTHLFAEYGVYLFCGQHHAGVKKYMTATQAHYYAWKNKAPIGKGEYNEDEPKYLYARSSTEGLYNSYKSVFDEWMSGFGKISCCPVSVTPDYQGDDSLIDSLKDSLPKRGEAQSIEYVQNGTYDTKDNIDAAFVLTQQKLYKDAKEMPANGESLSDDEKEKGYFTVDEKQAALWETGLNIEINGGGKNDCDDRNLGDIAKAFKVFYEYIKDKEKGYVSLINAIGLGIEGVEQTSVSTESKTYKFKEAKVEVDANNNKYIYGPFCLDYAMDDTTGDIYTSTGTNQVKFNAIEEIKVYAADKSTEIGEGNFQIVYEYKGGDIKGEKLHRISDEEWRKEADYKEVDAFESGKQFYVVVDANGLNPEQLKGVFVSVKMQYLDEVTATMYKYTGKVVNYFYKEVAMADQTVSHTAKYYVSNNTQPHTHTELTSPYDFTVKTSGFRLNREYSGTKAQELVGYACDGTRSYKTYTVILTTDFDDTGDTKIELEKVCSNTNNKKRPLAGAEYEVTIKVKDGKDAHGNDLTGKTIKLYRTTDAKGKITITSSSIAIEGLYLGTFDGNIEVNFRETKAPAGHEITSEGNKKMEITLSKGKIDSVSGGEKVSDTLARTTAENKHVNNPIIQIAKVNQDGKKIEEASFRIHVIYALGKIDPKTGEVIYEKEVNNDANVIGGTTEDGYLKLTTGDFMKLKQGFDFGTDFTGYITLQISEIGAPDTFSLSSENLRVTLHYKNGKLVKRDASEDPSVVVDYAYKNWTKNIQDWINAQRDGQKFQMYDYVETNVKSWINEQQAKHPELQYATILDLLEDYITKMQEAFDSKEKDNPVTADWDLATKIEGNNNVVQIIFQDTPGNFKLPDIETKLDFMELGGKVFWDYTETKGGVETNGEYNQGEQLLYGIEVELTRVDNQEKFTTITDENGEYRFKKLDPTKEYEVRFKYNGMQFEAKEAKDVGKYNTELWAKSSKGKEESSGRSLYKEINKDNQAFTYEELEGLYEEVANLRWKAVDQDTGCTTLSFKDALNQVKENHRNDKDIDAKVKYMSNIVSTSNAGTYPHKSLEGHFIVDFEGMNDSNYKINFAGWDPMYLYPGQLQIHQALVRRDKTDLELTTSIVDTIVSMNRYDTTYEYNEPYTASYHQYIYKEDYNYDTASNTDGIAYYTEDNVQFYVTYENTIKNYTITPTKLNQIIDYYNKEFNWKETYFTTKETLINGMEIEHNKKVYNVVVKYEKGQRNEPDKLTLGNKVNSKDQITLDIYKNVKENDTYKKIIIRMGSENSLNNPNDEIKIRLTYELVGDTGENGNAKDVLAKYLMDETKTKYAPDETLEGKEVSYAMEINHYAEIIAYETSEDAHIDRDSHPGNFDVEAYERAILDYQKAREAYKEKPSEENRLIAQTKKDEMTKMREDDTGLVSLTLSNSGTVRTLTGNVWEAVDNKVKSSLDLQPEYKEDGNERYVTWDKTESYIEEYNKGKSVEEIANANLEGITVELVELLDPKDAENTNDDGTGGEIQVVRAVTKTDKDGKYEFKSYIAGDYTVRFVYGEKDSNGKVVQSKIPRVIEGITDYRPINGQYYQSTKANPNTDKLEGNDIKYWYYNNSDKALRDEDIRITDNSEYEKRYSDAYDDSYTRLSQMNAKIAGTDSTSNNYDYVGNIEVESTNVTDPIYAYTSTMNLEIEYVRPSVTGNKDNSWYRYNISNVDFGVTPRTANDVNVSSYISNVKLYVEGSDEPLINADYDKSGILQGVNDEAKDLIFNVLPHNAYLDGILNIEYEQLLLQRAHLELTYTIRVTNASEYNNDEVYDKIYDKIKYIYEYNDKGESTSNVIGVVYYDENATNLVSYETRKDRGTIIYHNSYILDTYQNLAPEYRNQKTYEEDNENNILREERLLKYSEFIYNQKNEYDHKAEPIKSKATTIIDYPMAPLDFNGKDKLGTIINKDWVETEPSQFVSSRENYKIKNNVISLRRRIWKRRQFNDTITYINGKTRRFKRCG